MKMRQREILNKLPLDFKRENESQEEYIDKKIAEIKAAILAYANKASVRGFVLGLSGGIDSFVCASLVADAIKETPMTLYLMLLPCGEQLDISDSLECAELLVEKFDAAVSYETIPITAAYKGVVETLEGSSMAKRFDIYARGNAQARLRMVHQYAVAQNKLVIGTDHATENVIGYYTKYGDGATDFNPIDGLVKPDIYEIAKRYDAPESVMNKKPAAGLGISENDEHELGMSYDDIAAYLKGNIIEKEKMQKLTGLYDRTQHKRNLPASPMNLWWQAGTEDITHVVVDMIHTFIDGNMAAKGAADAVQFVKEYIDENPEMRVLYVRDYHPEDHCSFEDQGGEWPEHAVGGTWGCTFPDAFYGVEKTINTPLAHYNVFNKGRDSLKEEYSGFGAVNEAYGALKYNLTRRVVVSGIATEYCVKSTVEDLIKNGFHVSVLVQGLAYISESDHKKALAELKALGAVII